MSSRYDDDKRRRHRRDSDDERRSKRCKHDYDSRNDTDRRGGPIDFERHRAKLAKIFFREGELIQHGSDAYRDFWKFLRRYQAFEASKAKKGKSNRAATAVPSLNDLDPVLNISSEVYDKKLSQSFDLLPSDPKDLLNRIPFQDYDRRDDDYLSEKVVSEFSHILTLYMDFLQREKFSKLKKLRRSQADLPIAEYRNEIIGKLKDNQVIIVAGDTGCGKSTQVPQYLLGAGYSNIACTQPRRIACISLAKRVGFETLNEHGTEIGYQIRFERMKTDKTKVLFLTEGLLLRQVSSDPSLSGYDVIVLDEVHERHLHGDFLLGIVKCLVQQRSDLKVILMSATINIKLFGDYFHGEAPVIQVPGRLYPIKLQYHPIPAIEQSSSEKLNPAPYVRILQLIDKKYPADERGDMLIFMSGLREITTVADACKEYAERNSKWIVLPLHSTLSLQDQDKVFDYPPEGVRKCIVSTNIAETSVTIDGVRFVVDSGKVKEMHYDPVSKMSRLKEFWISRASAEQRKGRSGRTGPGVCFRLYADSEYNALTAYSAPEIQRVPLDNLILQMISMGLPDARKFPFIEPPPPESIENSILVLKEQGALNEDESLTVVGRTLANLPVDVSLGKMLIMGTLFHQIDSVMALAAALSVQSPFTNDAFRNSDCVAARKNLDSDHGDPITLLNAYREWLQVKAEDSEPSRKWCRKRGLEEQRFYEMTKLRAQFKELLEQAGLLKKDDELEAARMSSTDRAKRHGELKQLRTLKREIMKKEGGGNKKKKILKVSNLAMEDADEDGDGGPPSDIKDIEFRMRHDQRKVRNLLEGARAYTLRDLTLLKIILTSGLYPQLAVADEFNGGKASGADQLFHTKVKPFNVLHPNCVFAASPEYVTLESMDIVTGLPGFPSKYPASMKHQLLIYLSLLETNKAYVMNALRMPALQSLLLFSRSIDANGSFSRIVFDQWLELRFHSPIEAQEMMWRAARLRTTWQELLTLRLTEETAMEDPIALADKMDELESVLSKGLVDFIHSETLFSMRRLLPADIKVLYVGEGLGAVVTGDANPFGETPSDEARPHEKKGGLRLNEYLTYNCLENQVDELSQLAFDWTCPRCEQEMYVGPVQRIAHHATCVEAEEADRKKTEDADGADLAAAASAKPNSRAYECADCGGKTLFLTSTEILRHKRSHMTETDK